MNVTNVNTANNDNWRIYNKEWTLSTPNTIGEGNKVYSSDSKGVTYDKERKTIYIIIITW